MPKENEILTKTISRRLSSLASELKVSYETVLPYFLLERLALRIVAVPFLHSQLVFKGGYVGLRVYRSPRVTVDLDALLRNGTPSEIQPILIRAVESEIDDGVWFRFDSDQDLKTLGEYPGRRLLFRSGIGEVPDDLRRNRMIHLDLGIGDDVVPAPRDERTPFLLGGGALSWKVYPIETICSEKLHTLVVRGSGNSRSKDIYDLNLFLSKCDPALLKKALKATFRCRGDSMPKDLVKVIEGIDTRLIARGWKSTVVGMAKPDTFEQAMQNLIGALKRLI